MLRVCDLRRIPGVANKCRTVLVSALTVALLGLLTQQCAQGGSDGPDSPFSRWVDAGQKPVAPAKRMPSRL
mgnify:CR=1 FL=1